VGGVGGSAIFVGAGERTGFFPGHGKKMHEIFQGLEKQPATVPTPGKSLFLTDFAKI
jgi:hypothetical protein